MLDRDGTLIEERHYLSDPCEVELITGVADSLRELTEMGLGLVVITNQSGIGRGFFDERQVALVHQRMCELLEAEGVRLSGIYFCPHAPEDSCTCRKPAAALVERAVQDLGFDPQDSFVIGDKVCDIELGQQVGATTFLVRTGYGAQVAVDSTVIPDYVVGGVWEVVPIVSELIRHNLLST